MVEASSRKVIWASSALQSFRKAYEWIEVDSPQNANKFRQTILETVAQLAFKPSVHPLDRFKANNSGDFRAFEKLAIGLRIAILTQKFMC